MTAASWSLRLSPWRGLVLVAIIGSSSSLGFAWEQPVEVAAAKPVSPRWTPVEKALPTRIAIKDPQAAFERLTSHTWGNASRTFVQFNADGTYRHKVTTEVPKMGCPVGLPNFDHRGTWTMRWKDDHGLVQLETGDMLAIAFTEKQLFFTNSWLPRIDRLMDRPPQPQPAPAPKSYAELSTFRPNALYAKLAGARLKKTDRFNWFMYPTRVQFDPAGRFGAQFRGGECTMEGFWSLTVQGTQLFTVAEENQCDLRGPGTAAIGASNEIPEFEEDLVLFYGTSWRPETSKDDDQVFSFDSYSHSVRVTGRLTQPLRKGVAAKLELSFKAKNGDYDLEEIAISQSSYQRSGAGFRLLGEAKPLATLKLGTRLAQGKSITREVEIVPAYAGADVSLDFDFHYKDVRQTYHGRRGFLGPVEP